MMMGHNGCNPLDDESRRRTPGPRALFLNDDPKRYETLAELTMNHQPFGSDLDFYSPDAYRLRAATLQSVSMRRLGIARPCDTFPMRGFILFGFNNYNLKTTCTDKSRRRRGAQAPGVIWAGPSEDDNRKAHELLGNVIA